MGCGVSRLHADERLEALKSELPHDGKPATPLRHHFPGTSAWKVTAAPDDSLTSFMSSPGKKESTEATKKDNEKKEKLLDKVDGTAKSKEGGNFEDERDDEETTDFPGSPSFRVYFINNLTDDDDEDSYYKKNGSKRVTSPRSDHNISAKMNLKQEFVPKKEERGKTRRTLRKVMGGQTGMRNLFKGRSCHTPGQTSCTHNRNHLLAGKTPS
ncbi:unnamed protein product [Camellia sinensis]